MPYKSEKISISGTEYDRRQKLTPEQRAEIYHRYHTEEVSQRQFACILRRSCLKPEKPGHTRKILTTPITLHENLSYSIIHHDTIAVLEKHESPRIDTNRVDSCSMSKDREPESP